MALSGGRLVEVVLCEEKNTVVKKKEGVWHREGTSITTHLFYIPACCCCLLLLLLLFFCLFFPQRVEEGGGVFPLTESDTLITAVNFSAFN